LLSTHTSSKRWEDIEGAMAPALLTAEKYC
jgi:hypothetical protein